MWKKYSRTNSDNSSANRKKSLFKRKMSKLNQKIVLFIEPAHEACSKPSKIGNLFLNRFAIDEDAKNEILKIYHLEHPFYQSGRVGLTLLEGLDFINCSL